MFHHRPSKKVSKSGKQSYWSACLRSGSLRNLLPGLFKENKAKFSRTIFCNITLYKLCFLLPDGTAIWAYIKLSSATPLCRRYSAISFIKLDFPQRQIPVITLMNGYARCPVSIKRTSHPVFPWEWEVTQRLFQNFFKFFEDLLFPNMNSIAEYAKLVCILPFCLFLKEQGQD